jgi:hypothetical protein
MAIKSDDKALKNRLSEQIAREKAKAFLQNIGKRRPDAEPSASDGSPGPATGESGKGKRRKKGREN